MLQYLFTKPSMPLLPRTTAAISNWASGAPAGQFSRLRSITPGSVLSFLAGPGLLTGLFVTGLLLIIKGRPFFRLWMILLGATAGFLLAENLILLIPALAPRANLLLVILPLLVAFLLGLLFHFSYVAAGWLAGTLLARALLPSISPSIWQLFGRLACGLAGALLAHLTIRLFTRLALAGGGAWLVINSGWKLTEIYLKPLLAGRSVGLSTGPGGQVLRPFYQSLADVRALLLPPADPPIWFWVLFLLLSLVGWFLPKRKRG